MSDKAFYDRMSEEELASVLCADLETEEDTGLDMETLLYVMELYAQRQTVKPPKTAEKAYADFRKNYLLSNGVSHSHDQETEFMIRIRKTKLRKRRAVAVSAAVLILILGVSMGVHSRHTSTWRPVYRHYRDYLVLTGNYGHEHTQNIPDLASKWYPQWLPEGYERIREMHSDEKYMAHYQRGETWEEDTLNIDFDALTRGETIKFYKNPEAAERFEHDGTVFYVYSNYERNCAVGCRDGVVISVNGSISEEELIRIIESMPLSESKGVVSN